MKSLITKAPLALYVIAAAWAIGAEPAAESVPPYYEIGDFAYPVSTKSPAAQTWFNRGLALCHAFNHEEAVRCFEQAVAADPALAMAYWGMAYAWGPNINNMPIEPQQMAQAELAIRLAQLHTAKATPLEQALISALAKRYAMPVPEDRAPLNEAYATAMRDVYAQHSDDPLVAALFAESLMNLQPWQNWTPNGQPAQHTEELVAVLETGLAQHPAHPGLCHFYIHAIEASPHPEKALGPAGNLRYALPTLGHLMHMPTHIDVLVGDYDSVVNTNLEAIDADTPFVERRGPYNFYTLYRMHNYHFVVYGAMFDGQSDLALRTARELTEQAPADMVRAQKDFLDGFMPMPMHVLVRFGRWEDVLKEPEPPKYLPYSRAIWHYARALAYAATGRVDQAEVEQDSFAEAAEEVPDTSFLFQNPSQEILDVAEQMIAGEIDYRRGKFKQAFAHLREAVRRDDALHYDEPWGWMQPARHALGALLLERQQYEEAEKVYREDLRRHPKNPWALHGLAEALRKQGKTEEARTCQQQFTAATERSDIKIDRSCYCRLNTPE